VLSEPLTDGCEVCGQPLVAHEAYLAGPILDGQLAKDHLLLRREDVARLRVGDDGRRRALLRAGGRDGAAEQDRAERERG
jgi:hypothetical protein